MKEKVTYESSNDKEVVKKRRKEPRFIKCI